jgi:hypothetical protein
MHQISHKAKLLWRVHCGYTYIPVEEYSRVLPYAIDGKIITRSYTRTSKEQWAYLHKSYYYCTQIDSIFEGSFQEFIDLITKEHYRNPYDYTRKWYRWRNWSYYKSLKGSYRRKPHHEKKILTEQELAKREWNEKFKRDKSKSGWSHRGPGKSFKKISNDKHRAWERKQIYNENWERMNDMDYKYYLDKWMWD